MCNMKLANTGSYLVHNLNVRLFDVFKTFPLCGMNKTGEKSLLVGFSRSYSPKQEKHKQKQDSKNKLKFQNLMRFCMIRKELPYSRPPRNRRKECGGKRSGEAVGFGSRIYTVPRVLARWLLSTWLLATSVEYRLFQPGYTAWLCTFPYRPSRIPL